MNMLAVAYKYLKRYPFRALTAFGLILAASFFDGASFGMLIPLIQGMTGSGEGAFSGLPFAGKFAALFAGMTKARAVSVIFIFMFFLVVVKNLFSYLSNVAIAGLRFTMIRDLRNALMDRVLGYDMKFFDHMKTGHLVSGVNDETSRIGNFMLAVLQFVASIARIAAYLALLFIISWKASIAVFSLIAVVLIPVEFVIMRLKALGALTSRVVEEYNHKLFEILSGVRVIKARNTEEMEKKAFAASSGSVSDRFFDNSRYVQLVMPLSEVCVFGAIGVFFLVTVNVFGLEMSRAFPFIATYLLVLMKMLAQLNAVNNNRSEALAQIAAFDTYERVCDEAGKRTIVGGKREIAGLSKAIEFRDVSFSYEPGKEVLKGVTVSIPKGKVTAFAGPSGAGKSTIASLIPRFYDPVSGRILVDGIDIRELEPGKWRRKIGFISQDVFIFNMSVKDNIRYGCPEASDEDVERAARLANAHEFIAELPRGYGTIVGERGVRLSGGQKQRLSIARAVIHDPEILILDEATSSLDTETERLITAALERLAKDRTVIAIAHRLSTIFRADNIVVMDNGRVAQTGSHNDLISREGSYKKLYEAQFASAKEV